MAENWDEQAVNEARQADDRQHEIDRYKDTTTQRKWVFWGVMAITALMLVAGYCAAYEVFRFFQSEGLEVVQQAGNAIYALAALASLMLVLPLVIMVVFIKAVFGEEKKGIDWDALPSALAQLARALAGEISKR